MIELVDNKVNDEISIVPSLRQLLSEKKEQLMMHQWYLVESALNFQHWYMQTSREIFQFMIAAEG